MPDINRITRMEKALDTASAAVRQLSEAAASYADAQTQLQELTAYYGSEEWLRDLDDDANGLLPRDLKRGVLSEDAVYDLLCDHDAVLSMLREILDNEKTAPDEL